LRISLRFLKVTGNSIIQRAITASTKLILPKSLKNTYPCVVKNVTICQATSTRRIKESIGTWKGRPQLYAFRWLPILRCHIHAQWG
jgi:hypothetical protein